jgi:hypothetical protein
MLNIMVHIIYHKQQYFFINIGQISKSLKTNEMCIYFDMEGVL